MNHAQRLLIIVFLVGVGAVLASIFLNWGEGAYSNVSGDRIAILILDPENSKRVPFLLGTLGAGYGLYTTHGIPGVLLGLVAPLCLFAAAAYVALGSKSKISN